ncbi:MAG: hypothetical protein ABSB74_20265 [Tepidisphaeraceae bacterium]
MSEKSDEAEYRIELDGERRLSTIHLNRDDREIPIDPTNPDYCKFLTWAAKQSAPVAATFERLEKDSVYYGQEADVIAYCKQKGIVLLCVDNLGNGKHQLASGMREGLAFLRPIPLNHDPKKATNSASTPGQFLFYCLYKAAVGPATESGNSLVGERLPVFVSHILDSRLNELLADENSEIRSLSSWPVEKTFVYVDVSGFSQHPVVDQLLIINSLIQITTDDRFWRLATEAAMTARKDQEANLCIGDGYIFVFRKPWSAVYFAAHLAALIESMVAHGLLVDFHFRMSVNTGPVYRFWDKWGAGPTDGRWNYVGRGITDGERVLSAIGKEKDDVVFLSADTRTRIMGAQSPDFPMYARDIPSYLQNRGRQEDKHKTFRRLYELNHTDWLGDWVGRLVNSLHAEMARPSGI